MARIVAVHGIGQQFKGDAILHREWWPAMLSGLHLAGCNLIDEHDLVCPFYGNLFRTRDGLGNAAAYQDQDVTDEEAQLLNLLWQEAAESEPDQVPSPALYAAHESLVRTPQPVQRVLSALSKSKFFANILKEAMIGDLKQVVQYLHEPAVHEAVLKVVMDCITDETRVVIGHSLGSVIAYEALCHKPAHVVSFITMGSPLGIQNLIFDRLTPPADESGKGAWPGHVTYWTNVADAGDVVALQKGLAPFFGNRVKDVLIYNGSDAHHGERYLTATEVGQAICQGL